MGKTTGFLEYPRLQATYRPVRERIGDYNEISQLQTIEELHRQSARCMDCGVPFCHAGFVVDGLSIGCPIANLIPEINDLVYRGEIDEAYSRLAKTHPFPEITGRVCPALCEGSCTLGEHEQPVTIKDIERYVADSKLASGTLKPRVPRLRLGRKVAVVGSGPAGLACADMLNQLGNLVTVFERDDRPGGLLMYGIPNMKLDKQVVLNRARLLEQEGITFELGVEIGADYPVLRLMQEFDAIVLCAGAGQERLLTAPGAQLLGVSTAMQYLRTATQNLLNSTGPDAVLDAAGKNVIVVGGGDTGTDCVGTAIRQGAASVTQLEIMPKPPETRAQTNPWPLWPKVLKTDYGQQEAAQLFGQDPREYQTTVKEIIDDGAGRVKAVKTVEINWVNENGRMVAQEIAGSEKLRPADLVLTAMGFTGPEATLPGQLGLQQDARGNVATKTDYKTSLTRVFAAGDMRRGPSLVVWAIQEGRRAATACHEYLNKR